MRKWRGEACAREERPERERAHTPTTQRLLFNVILVELHPFAHLATTCGTHTHAQPVGNTSRAFFWPTGFVSSSSKSQRAEERLTLSPSRLNSFDENVLMRHFGTKTQNIRKQKRRSSGKHRLAKRKDLSEEGWTAERANHFR